MTVRPPSETFASRLSATAILMPDGDTLLFMEGREKPVPREGQLAVAGTMCPWVAEVWERGGRWHALAILDVLPRGDTVLFDMSGTHAWSLEIAPRISASARILADRARSAGANPAAIFDILSKHFGGRAPLPPGQSPASASFMRDFLESAAERDGFLEILVAPEGGGLFIQGWTQSLDAGQLEMIGMADPTVREDLVAGFFARPDLLSPARGLCLFHKELSARQVIDARVIFVEQGGRILRLDVVPAVAQALDGPAATDHVTQMVPRIDADVRARAAFRRACRPRFRGEDTLAATKLPIAAGFDVLHRAPDGGLLVMGWLLDPERWVRMAVIKSLQNRYGRISESWVRLPRPDLAPAFAADPRFAGRIDPSDDMCGFIAHVPPAPETAEDADIYLELVLSDDSCLFQSLRPTPVAGGERLGQVLSALPPAAPELKRIIDAHLAPFLSGVSALSPAVVRSAGGSAIALGAKRDPAPVAALMPFRSLDELQTVLALLSGTPDADGLDLMLIAPRAVVSETLTPLEAAFRFYGLSGSVSIAPEQAPRPAWFDTALAGSPTGDVADAVLLWTPQALPKAPGWLARLRAEARSVAKPGLIAPILTYEDGSIRFGPARRGQQVLGFSSETIEAGAPSEVTVAPPEIALIDRAKLAAAGGFAGHLFSDAYAHVDLSARLAAEGGGIWCSSDVAFWMLDDAEVDTDPMLQVLRRIDSRLLVRRGLPDPEEML